MHDPTTLDRQGPDVGNQYRSAIFYRTAEQREAALKAKERAESSGAFQDKIVTEIVPAEEFYPAEEYHQKYFQKRGTPGCHVPPKKKKIQD
jgi:peptide-methionine (S)-S-oxide reductase